MSEELYTKKDQSWLRKQVYDFLAEQGFKMNLATQKKLSTILKSVYEKRINDSHTTPQEKIGEHKIICPECGRYQILPSRNSWKQFKRKIPKEMRT